MVRNSGQARFWFLILTMPTYSKTKSVLSHVILDLYNRINEVVFKKFKAPWVKAKELHIIEEVLHSLNPACCLEWGSGYSTIYFPPMLPDLEVWQSIEHNKDWGCHISEKIQDNRVDVKLIEPDDPKQRRYVEGNYKGFRRYVDFPKSVRRTWDFIFIDGRARKDCLRLAYQLISDNGVVMLHDANRDEYLTDVPPFTHQVLFKDYRKGRGGIWIGSKKRKLKTVLDIKEHKRLWKIHEVMARIFFLR